MVEVEALNQSPQAKAKRNGLEGQSQQTEIEALRARVAYLEQQNFLYQGMLDSLPDVLVRADRDLRFVYANSAIRRNVFLAPQDWIGKRLTELGFDPEQVDLWEEKLRSVFETGQSASWENSFVGLDGQRRIYEVQARPQAGINGSVEFALVVSHDVTETQRAETLLRQNEQELQQVIESSLIGIIEADSTGRILKANGTFLNIIGWSRADWETAPRYWQDLTPPEYAERDRQGQLELQATGTLTPYEKEYFRKDGSRVQVLGGAAWLESSPDRAVGYVLDISERKRGEEQLREGEQRLQAILDNSPAHVYVKDLEGRYILVNKRIEQQYGRSRDMWLGRTDAELFSPEASVEWRKNDQAVLDSGQPSEIEELVPEADGPHTYLSLKFPLFGKDGRPYGLCGISTDITERKKIEKDQHFLAEASQMLSSSLDYGTTLKNLARLVVPYLADWCTVDIVDEAAAEQGRLVLQPLVVVHTDPSKEQMVQQFREPMIPYLEEDNPMMQALLTGETKLIPEIPTELIDAVTEDPEIRRILRELDLKSALYVPLVARGRRLGLLTLNTAESKRVLGPDEVRLSEELARRSALAIDNARLYVAEQQARREIEVAAALTTRLQAVTTAFSEALTPTQVIEAAMHEGVRALDAVSGLIVMVSERLDEQGLALELVGSTGYPAESIEGWRHFPLTAPVPIAEAVRTGEAVFCEDRATVLRYYPIRKEDEVSMETLQGLAALPMAVQGRVIGGIGFSFKEIRQFSQEEQGFMLALARGCGQALERARLYEAEQKSRQQAEVARSRLAFLAEASSLLAASLNYGDTLQSVAKMVVPRLADWCTVHVLDNKGWPQQVALAHADPARIEWATEIGRKLEERYPYNPDEKQGMPQVLRSGQPELYADIPDELLVATAQDTEQLRLLREIGYSSVMIVPLAARGRVLGVMQFVTTSESGRHYDEGDLALAQELARRSALAVDNARLYQEAQEAIQLRNEFLSTAAHELKTPITSLRGYAQLINRQLVKGIMPDPQRIERAMQVIDLQSGKLAGLVGQLLDVGRLDAGKLSLSRQETNLNGLVEEAIGANRVNTTSNHVWEIHLPATPLIASVDPVRIEQVVNNLLGNAIKYSPDGGTILVELDREDDTARLSVSDQGIGIEAEHRARIFERFYQAHPEEHRSGIGLGLYISRQIVELHGGSIQAEFPAEGGTRLVVRLPIA